uniref:Uncharacterized protein n=1 Tax=Oncorhynchus tshawytscha TaxID=74940 RepID=A0A8C8H8X5_ONCTS
MTDDHGLSNGDGPVDVAEGHELLLFAVTDDVVLLDGVQRLLFSLMMLGVWDDAMGKVPHHLLKRGREQENRTPAEGICVFVCALVPLNAYALVLVSLCSNHDIIQHGAWRPNHYLLLELRASLHWGERKIDHPFLTIVLNPNQTVYLGETCEAKVPTLALRHTTSHSYSSAGYSSYTV